MFPAIPLTAKTGGRLSRGRYFSFPIAAAVAVGGGHQQEVQLGSLGLSSSLPFPLFHIWMDVTAELHSGSRAI